MQLTLPHCCCRPDTPLESSLVLEVDIPSFTCGSAAQDEVPLDHQGKYLGLLDRYNSCLTTTLHMKLHMRCFVDFPWSQIV